jgi:hypothetical protein
MLWDSNPHSAHARDKDNQKAMTKANQPDRFVFPPDMQITAKKE